MIIGIILNITLFIIAFLFATEIMIQKGFEQWQAYFIAFAMSYVFVSNSISSIRNYLYQKGLNEIRSALEDMIKQNEEEIKSKEKVSRKYVLVAGLNDPHFYFKIMTADNIVETTEDIYKAWIFDTLSDAVGFNHYKLDDKFLPSCVDLIKK